MISLINLKIANYLTIKIHIFFILRLENDFRNNYS